MLTQELHSNWKWPNIEGINDFEGRLLHSAHWDATYDFKNKKVGVIGIGSSGIQIVPKLAAGKPARDLILFTLIMVELWEWQTKISHSREITDIVRAIPNMDLARTRHQ